VLLALDDPRRAHSAGYVECIDHHHWLVLALGRLSCSRTISNACSNFQTGLRALQLEADFAWHWINQRQAVVLFRKTCVPDCNLLLRSSRSCIADGAASGDVMEIGHRRESVVCTRDSRRAVLIVH